MSAARDATRIALVAIAVLAPAQAHGQDGWDPFKDKDERARQDKATRPAPGRARPAAPDSASQPGGDRSFTPGEVTRGTLPPLSANAAPVERGQLQSEPAAGEASNFPSDLWQGLDAQAIETHLSRLEPPLRSPTLLALWKRLWQATPNLQGSGQTASLFAASKLETLYRYGLISGLRERLGKPGGAEGPVAIAMEAKAHIGLGNRERGCAKIRSIVRQISELPKLNRADALLISGYCAVVEKNISAASVAAELVHDQNAGASTGLGVLDALAAGTKPQVEVPGPISLLDYRFLELAGMAEPAQVVGRADGPLLAVLATDPGIDAGVRVQAMEAARQPNAFDAELLAEVYRTASFDAGQLADPAAAHVPLHLKHALMFKAAETQRRPAERARLMRALLDDAQATGQRLRAAAILAPMAGDLQPNAELAPFAETMVEALLAAGRTAQARTWAGQGPAAERGLLHWLVLADIAEPKGRGTPGANLAPIEQLAARSKLASDLLHRLATVLDALDVQVPIPLWEAASRTPQPDGGHLPETGVLSQLQDAAKKKEIARTILLAMRAIGPDGAEGAHMIALGDAIRSLKRIGLERDARRLGFEALFAAWPRVTGTDR